MKEIITDNNLILDERIKKFIKRHNVLTLATLDDNGPYCCNCFYVFDSDNVRFIILSENKTQHISNILLDDRVAGTIFLDTVIIGKIEGVQFRGNIKKPNKEEINRLRLMYLQRFPFAVFKIEDIWVVDVNFIKFTDNKLGFGKKLLWKR